jgi:hypothetical protein
VLDQRGDEELLPAGRPGPVHEALRGAGQERQHALRRPGHSYCGCTLDYIQARVGYDEFKQADRAAATLNKAPKHARAVFLAAIKSCRKSVS